MGRPRCRKIISTLKTAQPCRPIRTGGNAGGADFVIVAFQIGGYDLHRTVLKSLAPLACARPLPTPSASVDHRATPVHTFEHHGHAGGLPRALMLQYVNPVAINVWAIEALPADKQVGLCHSVRERLKSWHSLDLDVNTLKYRVGGVGHMAFFLDLKERQADGSTDLYPELRRLRRGRAPKPTGCSRAVRTRYGTKC